MARTSRTLSPAANLGLRLMKPWNLLRFLFLYRKGSPAGELDLGLCGFCLSEQYFELILQRGGLTLFR